MTTLQEFLSMNPYYSDAKTLEKGPYKGHYAFIAPMMFTTGIAIHRKDAGKHEGIFVRWCYHSRWEAKQALAKWDGEGDPPGNWIKQKPGDRHGPGSTVPEQDRKA